MHFEASVLAKLLTWALLCLPPIAANLFPLDNVTSHGLTRLKLYSPILLCSHFGTIHDKAMT